jgi:hypothetical protein
VVGTVTGASFKTNIALGFFNNVVPVLSNGVYLNSSLFTNLMWSYSTAGTNYSTVYSYMQANGTTMVVVYGGSAGVAGTAAYTGTVSDRRLKRNIDATPVGDALALVRKLKVHSADMLHMMSGRHSIHLDYAMIADEVEAVLPQACVLPDGQALEYAALKPLDLVVTLWRAVQQLAEHIAPETLDAELEINHARRRSGRK